uniref:RING-Gid-type domain-containing protein n=1 Tax=Ciona savignyi TaxID=51511 RepID=H2YJ40_CIOSA
MEGCINTEKDVDKLIIKFDTYKKQTFQTFEHLVQHIEKLKEDIQNEADFQNSKSQHTVIAQANKKLKSHGQKLSSQHKDLHSSVSRIGKTVDRNFDMECGSINMHEILPDHAHHTLFNQAICEHFYRQGSVSIAESIAKDANLQINDKWRQPFVEMNDIISGLQNKMVEPALEWCARNREQLHKEKSDLEFKLHRLKFIELIKKGPSHQHFALQYSRHFQQFAPVQCKEIQQLMGCFLFVKQGLSNSPYCDMLSDDIWAEICMDFLHDACRVTGMSVDSPLTTSFSAGCQALPALLAIKSVIEQRQCSGALSNNDELPIDIDLDACQHYHSVFACPILRQQTTVKNPPLRLVCGHVISRDALTKLVSGSKVKCPYCPVEQSPNDAKEVFF